MILNYKAAACKSCYLFLVACGFAQPARLHAPVDDCFIRKRKKNNRKRRSDTAIWKWAELKAAFKDELIDRKESTQVILDGWHNATAKGYHDLCHCSKQGATNLLIEVFSGAIISASRPGTFRNKGPCSANRAPGWQHTAVPCLVVSLTRGTCSSGSVFWPVRNERAETVGPLCLSKLKPRSISFYVQAYFYIYDYSKSEVMIGLLVSSKTNIIFAEV